MVLAALAQGEREVRGGSELELQPWLDRWGGTLGGQAWQGGLRGQENGQRAHGAVPI